MLVPAERQHAAGMLAGSWGWPHWGRLATLVAFLPNETRGVQRNWSFKGGSLQSRYRKYNMYAYNNICTPLRRIQSVQTAYYCRRSEH